MWVGGKENSGQTRDFRGRAVGDKRHPDQKVKKENRVTSEIVSNPLLWESSETTFLTLLTRAGSRAGELDRTCNRSFHSGPKR